MKPKEKLKVS